MPGPRRSFATPKALRQLNPALLCALLGKFPDYLQTRQLTLPDDPHPDQLDYEALHAACMCRELPAGMDDVLSHISLLGTAAGWERIQAEARAQGKALAAAGGKLTYADLAMQAWLWNWPLNRTLLEESYARARIHARSSYVYFPPLMDVRTRYRSPDAARLEEMRQELDTYFVCEGLGKGTSLVRFDFEKEIWFLIRYPGRWKRQRAIAEGGEVQSLTFKPEEYDAVVYHKEYGDLRMNTLRISDRTRYRILFGRGLLDTINVFAPNARVITLEPLKGACLDIFSCADIPGLAEIAPVEVAYHTAADQGRLVIWRADKQTTLLTTNRLAPRLVPDDTDTVRYAVFRYRLKNKTRHESLTVHQGNTLTYERDGDSAVLEEWLRTRRFVKNAFAAQPAAT
jgi:hypothetical protein